MASPKLIIPSYPIARCSSPRGAAGIPNLDAKGASPLCLINIKSGFVFLITHKIDTAAYYLH